MNEFPPEFLDENSRHPFLPLSKLQIETACLLQMAIENLDALGEDVAACHASMAMDVLRKAKKSARLTLTPKHRGEGI